MHEIFLQDIRLLGRIYLFLRKNRTPKCLHYYHCRSRVYSMQEKEGNGESPNGDDTIVQFAETSLAELIELFNSPGSVHFHSP